MGSAQEPRSSDQDPRVRDSVATGGGRYRPLGGRACESLAGAESAGYGRAPY